MAINFISFNDSDEKRVTDSKSDNTEIIIYDKTDETTHKLLKSLLS